MKTKNEVLDENLKEWLKCKKNKEERGKIIERISCVLKIHKKSVGRSFKRRQLKDNSKTSSAGRKIIYGADVQAALFTVWDTLGNICAENLIGGIDNCILNLEKYGKWKHDKNSSQLLRDMSLGTGLTPYFESLFSGKIRNLIC